MKHTSGPPGKWTSFCGCLWRFSFAACLLLFLLVALSSPGAGASSKTFASTRLPAAHGFTMSPASGPVGTVITVTGANLTYADGTQISLGYTTNFSTCFVATDSQGGPVTNHGFSGWMRWPASTGASNAPFGVCVVVSGVNSFLVGDFTVLSASAPQVKVTPTIPVAGHLVTVTGANFLPAGVTANLVWQSASSGQTLALGTVTSDTNGAFTQTFTLPADTSTGSYSVTANSGTNQPPTLSATLTLHVDGVTIVPVGTPGTQPSPIATATLPAASPTSAPISTPAAQSSGSGNNGNNLPGMGNRSGLLLPLIIGGGLLIILALVGAMLLVSRQRRLATMAALTSGSERLLPPAPSRYTIEGLPPPNQPVMQQLSSPVLSGMQRLPQPAAAPRRPEQNSGTLPFDTDLAEAMRQAQVSLFAIPRPPVGGEAF